MVEVGFDVTDAWASGLEKLYRWKSDPSSLEDDGFRPPSPATTQDATAMALELIREGIPAPSWVVPDGDGGVELEWNNDGVTRTLVFHDVTPDGARRTYREHRKHREAE